ncbi:DUF488 domain-containing protein [Streptomyces sp. NBC_00212]|uniref:DUF488 domain-containing protein n=1 Tax=Streptomyces sp. NBC_00212 TaxID=2975684 RepID=UPI0032499294
MPGKRTMRVRRVYDPPEDGDGVRVLVDRLWPRGLSKERAAVDEWPKELTPSTELRRWYHEDRTRYPEFQKRYEAELAEPEPAQALDRLLALAEGRAVTLVTAVKDIDHSHVPTLVAVLKRGRPSG